MKWLRQIFVVLVGILFLTHCNFPPPTTSDDQVRQTPTNNRVSTSEKLADTNATVTALQEQVDQLKGKLEVVGYEIEQLRDQNKQFAQDFDARISVLESQPKTASDSRPSTADIARSVSAPTTSDAHKDDFDMMIANAMDGTNLSQTIKDLNAWLEKNPKDSKKLQAQHALATAYFGQKDYPRAIQNFQTVVDESPKSDEACDSRYHQGLSFVKLGDTKNAKLFFEETVELCPKHAAKKKAQDEIKKI